MFGGLGVGPAPPSLVEPVPSEKAGFIRILVMVANGYQVKWWRPRLARGGAA